MLERRTFIVRIHAGELLILEDVSTGERVEPESGVLGRVSETDHGALRGQALVRLVVDGPEDHC